MAWHLIVAVANPVASFRADRQPITDPRPAHGFVPRFKLLPCWAGSPLRDARESFSTEFLLSKLFRPPARILERTVYYHIVSDNREAARGVGVICIGRETIGENRDGRQVHDPGALDHRRRRRVFRRTARWARTLNRVSPFFFPFFLSFLLSLSEQMPGRKGNVVGYSWTDRVRSIRDAME